MELYTIATDTCLRDIVIDEYVSVIWTERFIEPGDVTLSLPSTKDNWDALVQGTLLGHKEARQPMLLDTREVKEGVIEVKGKTLVSFFDERHIDEFTFTAKPGLILAEIVDRMQSKAAGLTLLSEEHDLEIPNLVLGSQDSSGDTVTEKIAGGPAGPELKRLALKYNIGMGVYRVKNSDGDYELRFSTRKGADLYSAIEFSPKSDTLNNVRDFRSDVDYKTVAITRPPEHLSVEPPEVVLYNNSGDSSLPVLRQRILDVDCTDITEEDLGSSDDSSAAKLERAAEIMTGRARTALDDKNRVSIIDGEVPPGQPMYKYHEEPGSDSVTQYRLGDIVGVIGTYGAKQQKVVSEYIRSYDGTGYRSYPTLAENVGPTGEGGLIRKDKGRRTFIVGPVGEAIDSGTVLPPYSSPKGTIIGFKHVLKGGGSCSVSVIAGSDNDLVAEVGVTDTPRVTRLDTPYKIKSGDEVHIEIFSTSGGPSGLMFTVVYEIEPTRLLHGDLR